MMSRALRMRPSHGVGLCLLYATCIGWACHHNAALGEGADAAPADVLVSLHLPTDSHFVSPAARDSVQLELRSLSAEVRPFSIDATLELDGGGRQTIHTSGVLDSRRAAHIAIPPESPMLGRRSVHYTLRVGGLVTRGNLAFVVGTATGPTAAAQAFQLGASTRLFVEDDAHAERELSALREIGIDTVRLDPEWSSLQPADGSFHWSALDTRVEAARRLGLRIEMLLAYGQPSSCLAATSGPSPSAPCAWRWHVPRPAFWDAYVRAIVERYRGRVWGWEVWNEPDSSQFFQGSADDYIAMLRRSAGLIRAGDSSALVLTGGFTALPAGHTLRALNPTLQDRVLRSAEDAFDVHAVHGHADWRGFADYTQRVTNARTQRGSTRALLWNEVGFSSARVGEAHQARTLVKKLALAAASGAAGFYWYAGRDAGTTDDYEQRFGLLTADLQPKSAYAAYNVAISALRNAHFLRDVSAPTRYRALSFSADDHDLYVVWAEQASLKVRASVLGCRGDVQIRDRNGNLRAKGPAASVDVPISDEPVYVIAARPAG